VTYCSAVGPAYCKALFACCADPQILEQEGGTLDACLDRWETQCPGWIQAEVGPLLADGRSVLDPMHLDQCVSTLSDMTGGGMACDEPPRIVLQTSCWSAFRGQVPVGQPCGVASSDISFVECKDGLCENGVCTSFLKAGDMCIPVIGKKFCDYTKGEACLYQGNTATCGQQGEIGAACAPLPDASTPNWECKSLTCGQSKTCELPSATRICMGN
jgi:hypothetical protein